MNRPRKPHMTNQELATKLGLDHSTVSKYRNGTRTPSIETLIKVDQVLNWPIEEQITALVHEVYAPYLEERIARLTDS